MTLQAHPFAEILPLITGADFEEFAENIREFGLREPIVLHDKLILDGRNRFRALQHLVETGEVLGPGWGHRVGEALPADALEPPQLWFEGYNAARDGDPLQWVISKNIKRRHLSESQRAMLAARIKNLGVGRPKAVEPVAPHIPPIGGISAQAAAAMVNVGTRSVERAATVIDRGTPELQQAVEQGEVAVSKAAEIARLPAVEQPQALARALPAGARAIMGSRAEPDDSLDFFPTPPWATRALIERVFPVLDVSDRAMKSAWEPACGEGHIAEVLREYFPIVHSSDIYDYGYAAARGDFLHAAASTAPIVDWIITNPPFGDAAVEFVLRARELAPNVAMFFRSQWAVEGVDRYERLFRDRPPTLCAFFVERVPLVKGRWDPEASTATAYCWLVWMEGADPRPPLWIAPGCRSALTYSDDVERFTAHPVISISYDLESRAKAEADIAATEGAPAPAAEGMDSAASRLADGRTSAAAEEAGTAPSAARISREGASGTAREAPSTGGGTAAATPRVGTQSAPPHGFDDDGLDIPAFLRRGPGNSLPDFPEVTS